MKAALCHAHGAPSVLLHGDAPDPAALSGQLLIRVAAIRIEGGDPVNRAITVLAD